MCWCLLLREEPDELAELVDALECARDGRWKGKPPFSLVELHVCEIVISTGLGD